MSTRPTAGVPIFAVGYAGEKQVAQRADGQWFYRTRHDFGHRAFSRWRPCGGRPEGAWYDPRLGRARLPTD